MSLDTGKIGVAVTTHNRPEVRSRCVAGWRRHLPEDTTFVVVDDASDPPAEATFRFETNAGVARAKNKSIELLMDAGVDHLFLADDDCWPSIDDWWRPYTDSDAPHLMHLRPQQPHWSDGQVWASRNPNGCLLYVRRPVVDRVGGMRLDFGLWGSEHGEWSRRIHNAGFTSHPFLDVVGSDRVWCSLDFRKQVVSTLTQAEKNATWALRKRLRNKYAHSTDFVPYR